MNSAMQPDAFDLFIQWVWLPVTAVLSWIAVRVVDHGEKIAVLEKTVASTEVIRQIIKDENEPIEDKLNNIKREIDQIRAAVGSRQEDSKR